MKFKIISIFLTILILLTCSSPAQEVSPSKQINPKKLVNLIHYGDLIDVDILGSTEFDWRGTINPEGFLDGVDFIDEPVFALCQSEENVAALVAKGFNKLLRDPKVVVKILDRTGRAVSYLYGAVKNPQRFQIERPVRLNELLILSGGIDEKASGEIQILRTNKLNCENQEQINGEVSNILINRKENDTQLLKTNIAEIIKGGIDSNPIILVGDIITVTEAEPIYVIGGVLNPRKINARLQTTVSRAIASAGGFTKNADENNIVIFRRNKNTQIRIQVDYGKMKSDPKEDLILQKFDILDIGEKGNKAKQFPPIVKILEAKSKPLELPLRIIE